MAEQPMFVVATNPDPDSALPYLLRIPLGRGLMLKAREAWPRSSRVYCHPVEEWPEGAEVLEEVPVRSVRRRGPAVDLVLDRSRNNRAQFVFTRIREREAIFWQTAKVARLSRPGVRVPSKRPSGGEGPLEIVVDTRERYGYRFGGRGVERVRAALPAGDYAVAGKDGLIACVERKTLEDLCSSLIEGSLGFVMAELSSLPAAAVAVEGTYSALLRRPRVSEGWLGELVARLQVRYPNVPIVFLENRKLAEEWTYRFLAAAARDLAATSP